jgi:hypothetical protein
MFDNMSTIEILKLLAPVIAVQFLLMLFSLYKLKDDKVKFLPKIAWVFIVIFLNIVGPLAYLTIGRERY